MGKIFIIMGISGSGKTTVGLLLADKLNLPFIDADDHHDPEHVEKMQLGTPLTDEDRKPWLSRLHSVIKEHEEKGLVMACSALKEQYRRKLQEGMRENIQWVFLHGDATLLKERLKSRKDHFFSPVLFQSQIDILEEPSYGIHADVESSPIEIVDEIIKQMKRNEE